MKTKFVILALVLALTGVACDDGESSDAKDTPTTAAAGSGACTGKFPAMIEAANGPVTIEDCPERIVSLAPVATETLFAIGAGDQVVAVDDQSNYPDDIPKSDLSGFNPNVEAIAELEPDLVVLSNDIEDIVAALGRLDIPTILHSAPTDLEGEYEQIEQLGRATGHADQAADVVAGMKSEIEELVASVPELADPPTYYFELDESLFTITSNTFAGSVLALAGLQNVADPADEDGSGYPQLSAEFLVEADPDFIFLADTKCCAQSAETVKERPAFAGLTAVQEGRVVELDDDIASRWGPRIVELLRAAVDAVKSLAPAEASTSTSQAA